MCCYSYRTIFLPLGLCLIFAGNLSAEEPLSELEKLRGIYFDQLEKVTRPVDLKYGQGLVALQKALIKEDKIAEALEVKEEISRLKEELAGNTRVTPKVPITKSAEPPLEMANTAPDQDRRWRGDFRKREIDGETIYVVEADETGERMIYTELDDLQDEFDNRLTWRFDYRTEDYIGEGFDVRFNFIDLQRISRIGSDIRPNGNWIERTQPSPDLKNEDRVVVQIVLKPGKGEVQFKQIELLNR